MALTITASGTALPSPVKVSKNHEIIWSDNTGRSVTGYMIGDVIAQKKTYEVEWSMLTAAQVSAIETACPAGFFTLALSGGISDSLTVYRGTLSVGEYVQAGGTTYARTVSCSFIER